VPYPLGRRGHFDARIAPIIYSVALDMVRWTGTLSVRNNYIIFILLEKAISSLDISNIRKRGPSFVMEIMRNTLRNKHQEILSEKPSLEFTQVSNLLVLSPQLIRASSHESDIGVINDFADSFIDLAKLIVEEKGISVDERRAIDHLKAALQPFYIPDEHAVDLQDDSRPKRRRRKNPRPITCRA
jgi:hypothetical protein